jgi:PAS domain S-box-containing protein
MSTENILVVEDERIVALDISNRLKALGYGVSGVAVSGDQALSMAEARRPDLVLMDIQLMGEMDGIAVAEKIRDRFHMPVVYLTAHADDRTLRRAKATDPFGYVVKPFRDRDLRAAIEMAFYKSKMEGQLRGSEARYRNILETVEEGYYELDISGKFIFLNDSLCRILGYPRNELLGCNYSRCTDKETADHVYRILNKVCTTGEPEPAFEWESIRKDDTKRHLAISVSLIESAEGEPEGFRGMVRDITDHKRMETQLRQAQRMEAIGTLAGGIAHDFNNLLMGIQGNTSLMLMDIDLQHPHYEMLRGIEQHIKSGAELTKSLLGFAQGGKYEVKSTDLNALIHKSVRMFGRTKKEIRIHTTYEENIWTTHVDQGQIEQVLLNLYVNAWQAMPGGGELYLETGNVMLDGGYVRPFDVEPGKYVRISVRDTGKGMDDTTLQQIFDPFFTTKKMARGTGLGLASAYGIIKNHGGIIDVTSETGKGTSFHVYLPASEQSVQKQDEKAEGVIIGSEVVLLIDDEEMILNIGRSMLERLGYQAMVARSGKEAVEVFQKNRDRIDLIILDMVMPDMSGKETYDRLKEIHSGIKVLLSSGYSLDSQAQEILDRGCEGFMQKPFGINELSRKLREILDDN